MAIALLLTLLVLLVLWLLFSKSDIISPTSMMIMGFFLGLISFLMINNQWGVQFSSAAYSVIVVGILAFMLGNGLSDIVISRRYFSEVNLMFSDKVVSVKRITVLNILLVAVQIILTYWLYRSLVVATGQTDIVAMIASYRDAVVTGANSDMRIPGLLNQLLKISTAGTLVQIFYYFYTRSVLNMNSRMAWFVPAAFYAVQQLMLGGRLQVLRLLIFIFVINLLISRFSQGWEKSDFWKIVKNSFFILLITIPSFYALKFLLGRASNENILTYVLRYLGGSTAGLSVFLSNPARLNAYWGSETFMGIYDFLGRWINNTMGSYTLEWVSSPRGFVIGNVYGADRRYFADFGMKGVWWLNLFMGLFYGGWYAILKNRWRRNNISSGLLISYAFIIYAVFFQFFEGFFYMSVVSVGTVTQILIILIVSWAYAFIVREGE